MASVLHENVSYFFVEHYPLTRISYMYTFKHLSIVERLEKIQRTVFQNRDDTKLKTRKHYTVMFFILCIYLIYHI